MKKRRILIIAGIAVLAGMLLINPARTNPPAAPGQHVFATNSPPKEITSLMRAACFDCHSHETKWPWYSRVAPFSWWLVDHVETGRKELNFSEWPHDDPRGAAKKWSGVRDEVEGGSMPLPSYTWGHPEARLTDAQREQLAGWADQEGQRLRALAPAADTE
jgi:hypothetical protein